MVPGSPLPSPARLELRGLFARCCDETLLRGVDLDLCSGELVALVGQSGSGKTLCARAAMGLLPFSPGVVGGELLVSAPGESHAPYAAGDPQRVFRQLRGRLVAWMPQDAHGGLDPLLSVAQHLRQAGGESGAGWLARVGLPARVLDLHPHALSGGMAQRVALARALARGPRLLLADEPTTGLDPTAQDRLLRQLRQLCDEGLGVLLVTHDLPLAVRYADRVVVMHAGRVVESLPASNLPSAASVEGASLWRASARLVQP